MTRSRTMSDDRRAIAEHALAGLGSHRSDHEVLTVQCRRAHHVATVYDTPQGLVFHSRTSSHSHGSRDRVDTAKHGARVGQEYADRLAADGGASDALPAWCDCGPTTLSRTELEAAVRSGVRRVWRD